MRKAIIIPHFNTPQQLKQLIQSIPSDYHKDILIVDDASQYPPTDWEGLLIRHKGRKGYGAAQKTAYDWAISQSYQQVLLVHGDNQYEFMPILEASHHEHLCSLGSRLIENYNAMPLWRYSGNKILTTFANTLFRKQYSDLHSGARIYSSQFLKQVPYHTFSDSFLFDQQMVAYCLGANINITEFAIEPCYDEGVSSISLPDSIRYGVGSLLTLCKARYRAE